MRINRLMSLLEERDVVSSGAASGLFDRYAFQDAVTAPALVISPHGAALPTFTLASDTKDVAMVAPTEAVVVAMEALSTPTPVAPVDDIPATATPAAPVSVLDADTAAPAIVPAVTETPVGLAEAPAATPDPLSLIPDIDPMVLPTKADPAYVAPGPSDTRTTGAVAAGPVSPTLAQEVSWINALNPDGSITATSYWGTNGGVANKWGSSVAGTGATISYVFDTASAFTATEQATYLKAFAMWESVANVHFVAAADSSSVGVLLVRGTDGGAYEYGGYYTSPGQIATHNNPNTGEPVQATISIDTRQGGFDLSGSFDVVGGYGLSTVIHEVGHLLGLGHGGTYNGSVDASTQQYSAYDERMYSTMSYIFYGTANPKYAGSYPVTGTNWGITPDGYLRQAPHTVQMLDILAIQQLYGASQTTQLQTGTVYGFNTTITGALKDFFDFTVNTKPVVTLYNQGIGALDLSGYSVAQTINLNGGTFSSIAGLTNNLAIAIGTKIDTFVGGSGNDLIVANADGDTIDGGGGVDMVSFANVMADVTVSLAVTGAQATGGAGSVTLANVENLIGSAFNDTLTGDAGANVIDGGAGGDDRLDGGAGVDTVNYASATAGVTVSLSLTPAQNTIGAGTDTLVDFENLTGSAFNDILSGTAGNNVITGGGGFDTASYANAGSAVTVSLAIAGAQDTVGAGTDTLVGISALVGSSFADTLTGSSGNDTLDGGGGNDMLIGGAGDDTYIVNTTGVTITEAANGGTDTVMTSLSLSTYALPANVERLVYTGGVAQNYTGSASVDNVTGGSANDYFDLSQGGDDVAGGGAGNDAFYFGAAFTGADRVDGGTGSNDQIGLMGNYTGGNALLLQAATIANVETIAVLAGFDYAITTVDGNVGAGQMLTIYGSDLGAGDDLTFNGSAETDGMFRVYGGKGADTITTGAGDDGIYFGAGRFDVATDHVDGGAGTNDQMALDGSYTLTIARANVVNVEVLALLDGQAALADYTITLADDWTTGGEVHTVYAVGVRNAVSVDGHLETTSMLKFYGGSGNDTLIGGSAGNFFDGGAGADTMTGGAGIDKYNYNTAANSTGVKYDRIVAFDATMDQIHVPAPVTGIDTAKTGTLSTDSFDADLTAALATLGANHAVQFTAQGGTLDTHIFEVIDINGMTGYQAGQDMVIELVNPTGGAITAAVFI